MKELIRVDLTARSIIRVVAILVGFWFVYVIRDILLILFAAAIIAAAIEPLATWLEQRKIPRGVSVLLVYVAILLVISGIVSLVIPPLAQELSHLARALPDLLRSVERISPVGSLLYQDTTVSALQNVLTKVSETVAGAGVSIFQRTQTIFSGVATFIFIFILAFYLVVERDALKKLLRVLIPSEHGQYVEQILERVQRGIGRWLLAQLGLAIVMGVVVGVGLALLGVPYALLLGLITGLLEIIPVIGPLIAAIPGIVVGFSQSIFLGVATLIFYAVAQQAENHILVPVIMRRATGLNPLITMVALLLGARLAGLWGIILAVPVAMIISIFWSDFFTQKEREGNNNQL